MYISYVKFVDVSRIELGTYKILVQNFEDKMKRLDTIRLP